MITTVSTIITTLSLAVVTITIAITIISYTLKIPNYYRKCLLRECAISTTAANSHHTCVTWKVKCSKFSFCWPFKMFSPCSTTSELWCRHDVRLQSGRDESELSWDANCWKKIERKRIPSSILFSASSTRIRLMLFWWHTPTSVIVYCYRVCMVRKAKQILPSSPSPLAVFIMLVLV